MGLVVAHIIDIHSVTGCHDQQDVALFRLSHDLGQLLVDILARWLQLGTASVIVDNDDILFAETSSDEHFLGTFRIDVGAR